MRGGEGLSTVTAHLGCWNVGHYCDSLESIELYAHQTHLRWMMVCSINRSLSLSFLCWQQEKNWPKKVCYLPYLYQPSPLSGHFPSSRISLFALSSQFSQDLPPDLPRTEKKKYIYINEYPFIHICLPVAREPRGLP